MEEIGLRKFDLNILHFLYLKGTRRYSPLDRLSSSSCKMLWPSAKAFFALQAKKNALYAVLAYFRSFMVFCSNLKNFS